MSLFHKIKEFLLKNKSTRQTVAKNTFWLSISQVGSRLIRAVIIIYAARILGASEYGLFSYVLGFAGFFTIFADLGVNSLMTRDIAKNPEERQSYFVNSFWIKSILLGFTTVLIVFLAPYFTNIEAAKVLIPLVAILTIADGLREFAIAYLRGVEKMEAEAFLVTLMNIAILVSGLVILSYNQTARALLYTYMASVVFSVFLSFSILRKQFLGVFDHINKDRIIYVLKYAWPIAFSGMLGIFMLNTDMVMLGWWESTEEIGYYAASQRIIQVLYTLPALIASAIFPILSRLAQKNFEKEKFLNERTLSLVYLIAIPLTLGGIVIAPELISLLFSASYVPASASFRILLLTPLILFPAILISNLTLAHNKQKETLKFVAMGALGNVLFNTLLIPIWGIKGAAIATVLSQIINFGLTWRYMKGVTEFEILKHLPKIAASGLIMFLATLALKVLGVNVIIILIVSALIYTGSLFFFKEKTLEETRLILKGF